MCMNGDIFTAVWRGVGTPLWSGVAFGWLSGPCRAQAKRLELSRLRWAKACVKGMEMLEAIKLPPKDGMGKLQWVSR